MTQKQIIINQLKKHGYISRNFCLENFISRLGSRIYDLQNEGFKFTENHKGENPRDYYYYLKSEPSEIANLVEDYHKERELESEIKKQIKIF